MTQADAKTKKLRVRYPLKGKSEAWSLTRQPEGTAFDALNARPFDYHASEVGTGRIQGLIQFARSVTDPGADSDTDSQGFDPRDPLDPRRPGTGFPLLPFDPNNPGGWGNPEGTAGPPSDDDGDRETPPPNTPGGEDVDPPDSGSVYVELNECGGGATGIYVPQDFYRVPRSGNPSMIAGAIHKSGKCYYLSSNTVTGLRNVPLLLPVPFDPRENCAALADEFEACDEGPAPCYIRNVNEGGTDYPEVSYDNVNWTRLSRTYTLDVTWYEESFDSEDGSCSGESNYDYTETISNLTLTWDGPYLEWYGYHQSMAGNKDFAIRLGGAPPGPCVWILEAVNHSGLAHNPSLSSTDEGGSPALTTWPDYVVSCDTDGSLHADYSESLTNISVT
ncbi:MAG: hypothetical protein ACOC4K_02900 [Verrucomicrobiota bacterium]